MHYLNKTTQVFPPNSSDRTEEPSQKQILEDGREVLPKDMGIIFGMEMVGSC